MEQDKMQGCYNLPVMVVLDEKVRAMLCGYERKHDLLKRLTANELHRVGLGLRSKGWLISSLESDLIESPTGTIQVFHVSGRPWEVKAVLQTLINPVDAPDLGIQLDCRDTNTVYTFIVGACHPKR